MRVIYHNAGEIIQVYKESEHSHDSLLTAEITDSQIADIGNYAVYPGQGVVYRKTQKPKIGVLKSIIDGGVKLVDGEYRQEWKVVDKFKDGEHGKTKKEREDEYLAALKKEKYDILRESCHEEIQGMVQGEINNYGAELSIKKLCKRHKQRL